MIILGLSGGHDANWAILKHGQIVGAYEKERFTRQRHAGGNVVDLAKQTLDALGIAISDIELIATSEPVHKGLETGTRLLGGSKYRKPDEWQHQVLEVFGRIYPAVSIPHHLCHAAYSALTSPFPQPVAVTMDGGGDFYTEEAYTCTTVSAWTNGRLDYLEPIPNASFGSLWFTYAKRIFGDGNHSGKLMGLAALGDSSVTPAFYDRFTAPITGVFGGVRSIKDCWPDFQDPPFANGLTDWRDPQARRIARAVQDLTTRCGVDLLTAVASATGRDHLVLGGGVALNGYLTAAARKAGIFQDVHVPPSVHDGGIALGAALFAQHNVLGETWNVPRDNELARIGRIYQRVPEPAAIPGASVAPMDTEQAARRCAELLSEGAIVAVFEGHSEHGPRALGNRSLLASASTPGMRSWINEHVKSRESFRPLAPVVHQPDAQLYFEMDGSSPYMMYIVGCTPLMQQTCPEAVHVDNTARVQTIRHGSDFLSSALKEHRTLTGIPVLLNTSFNLNEPIVETPSQAIDTFSRMHVDALWLDGWWYEKHRRETNARSSI